MEALKKARKEMMDISNAEKDKIEAKTQEVKAKLDELKAQMKEASADARIAIKQKISELEAKL